MESEIFTAINSAFPQGPGERLAAALSAPSFVGKLDRDIVADLGTEIPEVMLRLLPLARQYALADFRVGAVVQGAGGALYFGANLEVPRSPLAWTVHAEQSSVLNALVHGEKALLRLAVTAPPCGHCRQFLHETAGSATLEILLAKNEPLRLPALLPQAFGPSDLGVSDALLAHHNPQVGLPSGKSDQLTITGLEALRRSYSPYTHSPSAIALETADGTVVAAPYVENAAYNPSLAPMLAALDRLRFHRKPASAIRKAALFEIEHARISQVSNSREILKAAGSNAELHLLSVPLR